MWSCIARQEIKHTSNIAIDMTPIYFLGLFSIEITSSKMLWIKKHPASTNSICLVLVSLKFRLGRSTGFVQLVPQSY